MTRTLVPLAILIAACLAWLAYSVRAGQGSDSVTRAGNRIAVAARRPDATNRTIEQDGNRMVAEAQRRVEAAPSIVARIRHKTNVFGQQLVGAGEYWQLKSRDKIKTRLDLSIRTEDQLTSLSHINDGRYLWIHENRGGERRISRIELEKVRTSGRDEESSSMKSIGMGGLPRLLASLRRNFEFRSPQAITFEGVPVWAVVGDWRPNRLARFLKRSGTNVNADEPIRPQDLPPYFPSRVFILFGRDGLFPYRIEYQKETRQVRSDVQQNGPLSTMDLFRVRVGASIDPIQFRYDPENLRINDDTTRFLKSIQ